MSKPDRDDEWTPEPANLRTAKRGMWIGWGICLLGLITPAEMAEVNGLLWVIGLSMAGLSIVAGEAAYRNWRRENADDDGSMPE